ncbi:GHKL domain protein [Bacteriovorax sp. DB6_IX]|nr:GHKL domain protein [Bacteriovorax sp. DB6_IX]
MEFSIFDSGKGVSEDIKSLILSGGKTTKKVGKGMGIGLQVVTEIIREHHEVLNSLPLENHLE